MKPPVIGRPIERSVVAIAREATIGAVTKAISSHRCWACNM
jgi:hypothetical protein